MEREVVGGALRAIAVLLENDRIGRAAGRIGILTYAGDLPSCLDQRSQPFELRIITPPRHARILSCIQLVETVPV